MARRSYRSPKPAKIGIKIKTQNLDRLQNKKVTTAKPVKIKVKI